MKDSSGYRTLLPHEPLPSQDAGQGFVHVQGSFKPRASANDVEILDLDSFWTKEHLQEALLKSLGEILPFPTLEVRVTDDEMSKVRLVYESTEAAFHVSLHLRQQKVSPAQLLSAFGMRFSSRPLQVSQLTREKHDLNVDVSWTRSNPPKFRRLLPRPGEDPALLEEERRATRFVFISNILVARSESDGVWNDSHVVAEAIRSVIDDFDSSRLGVEVFVTHKKLAQYCHVGMRSPSDAQALLLKLQGKQVVWKWHDHTGKAHERQSANLFLDYASVTDRSVVRAKARAIGAEDEKGEPTRSECTSVTAHLKVPGLVLVPNFVNEAQEEMLVAVLTGPHAPWAPLQSTPTSGRTVRRRVQHYGYVFDYKTADVLRDRGETGADCPPMPALSSPSETTRSLEDQLQSLVESKDGWSLLAGIVEKVRQFDFGMALEKEDNVSFPALNQMTVNQYEPGEGIGSHVDTPSAFGDGLLSLSLNSSTVMEFRNPESGERKLVNLPRRSLLLMSGPARFDWEHMIVTRKTDTVDGVVVPRNRRISLTLRTALDESGNPMPSVESSVFPPVWGKTSAESELLTPACEREHVHAVYDAIATQWHHTRGRRGVVWPGATQFLQRLKQGSVVADIGCGDGKYFGTILEAGSIVIGTDISLPLLKTAFSRDSTHVASSQRVSEKRSNLYDRPSVAVADCMALPLRTNSFDAAICIAVLHHISTYNRRRRCIEELARIVRPGGLINIQAWALEQDEDSRRKFATNDVFVPFNAQPKYLELGADPSMDDSSGANAKSTAQVYSESLNAEYDDRKGLVVFQRYCHLYRKGELEDITADVPGVSLVESGYETGNYFVILKVLE